ncbi:putative spermidine/putrescine transport system ATP-binding protein/spermidine/putrescine transport system ATP-binding protein [Haladaptatus litoreus]|uniref:Molybdate/tungstate import ATP-binding protein WtpC n=1 Tax=Haladaptatus litoreus TaxID=553468 RepID=A0A1N7CHE1_9EURY|nr:ABC transporter ATP-binding protein [Haladaptatus litoreus]SIR62995.1 putative spermidine/putrescine transport system ATP-binding protein/spermidine/putrescine transport system ATP-binding protein [Haladaptatus litoreus]
MSTESQTELHDSQTSPANVIEIRSLRKVYDDVIVAVDDVDLGVREGEFFTILGPSGSGKSTLLQMITGIETPTAGEIRLDGALVNDVKPYNRNTSLVFQEYALFPHMSARENVEYGLMLRGIPDRERHERADAMFELMNLVGKEDRPIQDLSGGERQRVATARSLVVEPDVLLLDEVLGALDEKLAREMQVELKRIQEEVDKTFIFVTHSQEEAFSMSDRIAIMNDGNVEQVGEPFEIYQNPASEFVADFLQMPNVITGDVVATESGVLTVRSDGLDYVVAVDDVDDGSGLDDRVTFLVPNEQVVFSDDHENAFEAVVTDTIFKGPHTEYALELPNGRELRAHETTGESLLEERTDVTVGFDPAAAKLFS